MFSKRHPRSCVENGLWLAKRGNRETSEEAFASVRGKVDGGLNEQWLHGWGEVVRFEVYLNVELVTFPDGLNGSSKSKKVNWSHQWGEWVCLPFIWEVRVFFRGVFLSWGYCNKFYHKLRSLKTTGMSWFTILET